MVSFRALSNLSAWTARCHPGVIITTIYPLIGEKSRNRRRIAASCGVPTDPSRRVNIPDTQDGTGRYGHASATLSSVGVKMRNDGLGLVSVRREPTDRATSKRRGMYGVERFSDVAAFRIQPLDKDQPHGLPLLRRRRTVFSGTLRQRRTSD